MARVEVDYKAPVEQGDVVHVHLGVTGFGRSSFVFEYELIDQRGRLVATAKTIQVMYDYATNKSVPVLQAFKDKVAEYEGQDLIRR